MGAARLQTLESGPRLPDSGVRRRGGGSLFLLLFFGFPGVVLVSFGFLLVFLWFCFSILRKNQKTKKKQKQTNQNRQNPRKTKQTKQNKDPPPRRRTPESSTPEARLQSLQSGALLCREKESLSSFYRKETISPLRREFIEKRDTPSSVYKEGVCLLYIWRKETLSLFCRVEESLSLLPREERHSLLC